ncbi:hypothetical protein ACFXPW_07875 [Streptomyces goshikiensis]
MVGAGDHVATGLDGAGREQRQERGYPPVDLDRQGLAALTGRAAPG